MAQWLGLSAVIDKDRGLLPGQETKVPQGICRDKKKLLLNSYENYKVPESKNAKSVLNIEVGITVYFSYPIFYGFGLICLCILRYGLP